MLYSVMVPTFQPPHIHMIYNLRIKYYYNAAMFLLYTLIHDLLFHCKS